MLTRLPNGRALQAQAVAIAFAQRFPDDALTLTAAERAQIPTTLADAHVSGGATYDGLIALEAKAHDETLLTLDVRARETYARLGVDVRPL